MNKNKLKQARNKVDQLDQKIFNLIKKRTQIIKYMLSLKKFKKEIINRKRNNEILRKIRVKSIKNGIDPKITKRIWKAIIWSYVDYQRRNFKNNTLAKQTVTLINPSKFNLTTLSLFNQFLSSSSAAYCICSRRKW